MPTVLTFSAPLNVSCAVGDTAYYVATTSSGGFNINSANVIEIGIISDIDNTLPSTPIITVQDNLVSSVPNGSIILFSKDNKANMSSALGYYAEVKLRNSSDDYSELFRVGMDIFESSK